MDGGTWWATVHGVTKSWTPLSDYTFYDPSNNSTLVFLKVRVVHLGQRGLEMGDGKCIQIKKNCEMLSIRKTPTKHDSVTLHTC